MTTSNMSYGKVSGTDLKEILRTDIQSHLDFIDVPNPPKRVTYFVLGETGNGKTQIINQVAKEFNLPVVELNLGNAIDPVEITGVRVPIKDESSGKWRLKLVPLEEIQDVLDTNKPFVLFLDELGAEAPSMRNFLLKLTDEGKLNGIDVSKAYVVAAGNPPGKDYGTRELEAALRGRMTVFECRLKPNEVADYFEHLGNDKEPERKKEYLMVANYLRSNPSRFNGSDGEGRGSLCPARCARAYHYAVHTIHEYKDRPRQLMILLQGMLGPSTGGDLSDYVTNIGATKYSPDDILQGNFEEVKNSAQWRDTVDSVLDHIGKNNMPVGKSGVDNLIRFIEFGTPDLHNGVFRTVSRNDNNLPQKVQSMLLAKMKKAGIGEDAATGEVK